jgi:hypothetical protein
MACSVALVKMASVLFSEQSTPGAGSGETRAEHPQSVQSEPEGHTKLSMPYRSWYVYGWRTAVALSIV